ncbi:transcription factor SRM1 [Ricinus communis]|uniref:DNA binding protein, putative n=1 Tax=Ricinus communis TaxID=3988 RepID=B9SCW6_RICCO|nr:transcription factor SRM1 [Ricinus communis]EEF38561.1 DNA binding protein, putative [Ricinus communis]|eukprot:XP_002523835.1 transcription factor SRM1 [Ricinus communis]
MIGASPSSSWSRLEDKLFERALVVFPEETPDRWEKIASHVPGKSRFDVKEHYEDLVYDVKEIDSGRVELPSYGDQFGLGWGAAESGTSQVWFGSKGKEKETSERRKGVPWTEEEHRLFLIGLQRYGKGDWRSISRNAVVSRTPTQVASHAQKYFLRLNSVKKEKKRPSIHDITTSANSVPPQSNDHNWADYMDPKPYPDHGSPSSAFHGFGFPV